MLVTVMLRFENGHFEKIENCEKNGVFEFSLFFSPPPFYPPGIVAKTYSGNIRNLIARNGNIVGIDFIAVE